MGQCCRQCKITCWPRHGNCWAGVQGGKGQQGVLHRQVLPWQAPVCSVHVSSPCSIFLPQQAGHEGQLTNQGEHRLSAARDRGGRSHALSSRRIWEELGKQKQVGGRTGLTFPSPSEEQKVAQFMACPVCPNCPGNGTEKRSSRYEGPSSLQTEEVQGWCGGEYASSSNNCACERSACSGSSIGRSCLKQ